jgi:hypothetical protein
VLKCFGFIAHFSSFVSASTGVFAIDPKHVVVRGGIDPTTPFRPKMYMSRWDISALDAKPTVADRCKELLSSLQNLQLGREDFKASGFFAFLPVLVSRLFGLDNAMYAIFCLLNLSSLSLIRRRG